MHSAILIQITAVCSLLFWSRLWRYVLCDYDPDYGGGHSTTQVASYQEWVRVSGPPHGPWVGINVVLYIFPTPLHTSQIWSRQTQQCIRVLICWMERMRGWRGGREYRIIYRGRGFLAVYHLAFGSSPSPSPPASFLSFLVIRRRETFAIYKTFNTL